MRNIVKYFKKCDIKLKLNKEKEEFNQ